MAAVSAAIAGAALAYGVYAGERQQAAQVDARRRTKAAQDEALRIQMVERSRAAQQDLLAANRPPVSIAPISADMLSQTDRTGGVDDRLRLGKPSKLGGGI